MVLIDEIQAWWHDWKNVHEPPPELLFHYTDAAGIQGIVTKDELWASHVEYLNDAQEFRYARELVLSRFNERIQQTTGDVGNICKIRDVYESRSLMWQSIADIYIACFCEDGDLLSQWRAYAAHGEGFAIGFNAGRIFQTVCADGDLGKSTKLLRVIYDVDRQHYWIDLAIDKLLAALNTNTATNVLEQVPLMFSEIAFSFKHPAFREEREWRLVCSAQPELQRIINIRVSGARLLPYVAIQVGTRAAGPSYVQVIHGPTTEAPNTQKALKILIGKAHPNYWTDVNVTGSEAPLRSR